MSCGNDSVECEGAAANSSDAYFSSYDDLNVHELMLKDKPRTLAYRDFLEKNRNFIEGKVVMDVGAGTGILSMFAAKFGARKVYAVEASGISQVCEALVAHNGLDDVITVLHQKVEDVTLENGTKVDIIISEWMGFYLLHESMLSSIIAARDKFLKEDGAILPSTASLYLCPVSMKQYHQEHFNFWQDVYGFDFSPVLPAVKATQLSQPLITEIDVKSCLTDAELVTHLDLLYVGEDELRSISGQYTFKSQRNDVMHGFCCWFDVEFEADGCESVVLSTGPASPQTHWKQTVVMLPFPLLVCKNEEVTCMLNLLQDADNPRRYNISIEVPEDESESDEDGDGPDEDRDVRNMIIDALEKHSSGVKE